MNIPIFTGHVYHVFNKSIAGFKIFNNSSDYCRMKKALLFFKADRQKERFARYTQEENIQEAKTEEIDLVDIISYCIMPTHVHFVLRQTKEGGISRFIGNLLNSYTKYFNTKYKRKGPLWEGRFKKVLIDTDEQLLHLTRYIHLNPVTAFLVDSPEKWPFSSYKEYLNENKEPKICNFNHMLSIRPEDYNKFVVNRIDYQRCLAKIKYFLLEENVPCTPTRCT